MGTQSASDVTLHVILVTSVCFKTCQLPMQFVCLKRGHTNRKEGKKAGMEERGQQEASTSSQVPISNPGAPVGTEYVCSPALCHM